MNKRDHILAVIKAGLNAVPVLGGSIASLIGDYIPSSTQNQLEQATHLLAARLTELESRIDVSAADKEQFAELFKSAYLILIRSHHLERNRAAIELIANCLLAPNDIDKVPYDELDHFARCLDNLSIGAIRILVACVNIAAQKDPSMTAQGYRQFNVAELDGLAPDHLVMGLVSELNSLHLVHILGTPPIRIQGYANYPLELTMLGSRFVKYVLNAA